MDQKRKKRLLWQLPFLAVLIIGTILIIRQQHATPYRTNKGAIFGTFYSVTYQWNDDLQADIEAELLQVDSALSMFNPQSVISHFNREGTIASHKAVNRQPIDMFFDVYRLAMKVSEDTNGAFDITVAPLVNAWGFGFKSLAQKGDSADIQPGMPTRHQVDSIRQFVGWQKVSLKGTTVKKSDPRIMLDCSAIAKGYGVDVVARLLKSKGVTNFVVEIGGEVVTSGISPRRVPWTVGVVKPTDDSLLVGNEYQTVLNVTDKAMATSGNYRNFYYKNGKKYAHTIDPKTGYPVQHNILSATVLADDCATADAYATSFMVLGLDGTRRILDRHPELMAYLIYSDEKGNLAVWYSPTMKDKIVEEGQ